MLLSAKYPHSKKLVVFGPIKLGTHNQNDSYSKFFAVPLLKKLLKLYLYLLGVLHGLWWVVF